MATIGNLSVSVTADTTGLASGLKTSESLIGGFSAKASALTDKLIAVGPAAIAAGAAIGVVMVKNVIDAADKLTDLSERTGIAIEDLSRLGYVAQMSGISADEMTGAINRLSQSMANGNSAFEAMGVSVRNADGSLRSQVEVLGELADKFATYRDGTAKTALAMELFGKSGASLIPVLNGGSAGIAKLSKESDKLGNTISTELAESSAKLNDNLDKLAILSGNAAQSVAGKLTPSLVALTDVMIANIEKSREQGSVFSKMIEDVANNAVTATSPMMRFLSILMQTSQMLGKDPYANETAKFQRQGATTPVAEQGNAPDVKAAEDAKKAADEREKQRQDELKKIRENELAKVQAFVDALKLRQEERRLALMTEQEQEADRYKQEQEKMLEALELGKLTKAEYDALEIEARIAHNAALDEIESARIKTQLQKEHDAARERMTLQQQVADHAVQVQQDQTQRIVGLLNMLGSKNKVFALAAIALQTKTAFVQNKVATALAGNLAFASQIIPGDPTSLARATAAKAYALSQGAVTGGLILAAGAVQAASLFGSSGGGSTGGTASAGSIRSGSSSGSVNASSGMTAAPAQAQTITIQMQGEIFGREQVRALITEINDAVADGAVLRLA